MLLALLALIFLPSSSLSDPVIYRRTGDEVVISSGSGPGRITAITWKHNTDIAVEWYGGEPSAYRHFNGHTTLDVWTGVLTISNLTRDHSGSYTAEINNRVANTTEVRIISSVIYKGPGDEVVISSGSDLGNITTITWKHNEDIAVKWYRGEPSASQHFNGCTTLDTSTGALTISGLTRNHSGFYTAEINNRVIDTTEVRIISPVPKPTVSEWCDTEMTYCTLTCEGSTTDSGPVTYSWEIFDARNYSEGQRVNITKKNPEPWYRCEMKNPISSETSEEFPNPFSSSNQTLIIILILLFLFLLLIGLIVGIVIHRKRKATDSQDQNTSSNDLQETETENAGLNGVHCNGVVPAVSTGGTSAQNHTSYVDLNMSSQTVTTTSEGQEALMSVVTSNESENAGLNGVHCNGVVPAVSTEGTSAQNHTSHVHLDMSSQTVTTTSEGQEALMSVVTSNESATDSQDQNTSSNDLKTAASKETEESTEESNEDETKIPLLKQSEGSPFQLDDNRCFKEKKDRKQVTKELY